MKIKIHLFASAIILIALGVICILSPFSSFSAIAWLIGLLICCSGVITLLFGLKAQAILPNAASTTLLAIFQIVIGIIFMLNGWIVEASLVVVFAVWMLMESISIIVGAIDYKKAGYQQWWLMLIFGMVSIIMSFFAICNPATAKIAITALLGIGLLSMGIVRFAAIPAVSRLQKRMAEIRETVEAVREEAQTKEADATEVK